MSFVSIATAKTIDIHAHVVLEETFGAAGAHGPELSTAPDGRSVFRVVVATVYTVFVTVEVHSWILNSALRQWIKRVSTSRCCRPIR